MTDTGRVYYSSLARGVIGRTAEAVFQRAEAPLAAGPTGGGALRGWTPPSGAAWASGAAFGPAGGAVFAGTGYRRQTESEARGEPSSGGRVLPLVEAGTPSVTSCRTAPFASAGLPDPRNEVGDHVDAASGRVSRTELDVDLPGALRLRVVRRHLSGFGYGRAFGTSWASTLDIRLEVDERGALCVCEDGMVLVYPPASGWGSVLPEAGPEWPLVATVEGYEITKPQEGVTWHFDEGEGLGAAGEGKTGTDTSRVVPLSMITYRAGGQIRLVSDEAGRPCELAHSGGYRVRVAWRNERVVRLELIEGDEPKLVLRTYEYTETGLVCTVVDSCGAPTRYRYDQAGRLVKWTDRNGRWYSYQFDQRGRCVSTKSSERFRVVTLAYDESARTTTVTDGLDHRTVYTLNKRSQVIRVVDPAGGVLTRRWDQRGHLIEESDQLGAVTRFLHDQAGNLVETVSPDGTRVVISRGADGLPLSVTDRDGAVRVLARDRFGQLVQETDPAGAVTRYGYDSAGHPAWTADPLGGLTKVECDRAGLPTRVVDPAGAVTTIERNLAGQVVQIVEPAERRTALVRDSEGRVTSRTGPDGAVESWTYDRQGNPLSHTGPDGAVTRFEYTAFDQLMARVTPDGCRLELGYDANLRLVSVTDQNGLTWSYEYDPVGDLVAETNPDGRVLRYGYDPAGRLVELTNGLGQSIRLTRDAMGRPVARDDPEGRTTYQYDPAARLTRATSPAADLVLSYDRAGRVCSETVDGKSVTISHDLAGRRLGRNTPTGLTSAWTYDSRGAPASLTTAGHTWAFTHGPSGDLVDQTLITAGSWQILRHTYDPAGRLLTKTLFAASGGSSHQVMAHDGYVYLPGGQLTAVADERGETRTLERDAAGRVVSVTGGTRRERYAYGEGGRLVRADSCSSEPDPAGGEREYEGTLLHRAGKERYEYDGQGRLVLRERVTASAEPEVWRYAWDSADRLVCVRTPEGTQWFYRYDPLGRRLSKARTNSDGSLAERVDFTWDGPRLIERVHYRLDAGPTVATWDYLPGADTAALQTDRSWPSAASPGEIQQRTHIVITDVSGIPTRLATVSGDIVWRAATTALGLAAETASDGADCPFRLPGHYLDRETGYHCAPHGYYDPATGQQLTADRAARRSIPEMDGEGHVLP